MSISDPTIGEISMFGGNFAPRGWALCDGQLLPISQYSALFSILGTTYGGDGRVTFALPDLRSRVPMHAGNGPGLSQRRLGQRGGREENTLVEGQLPPHTHNAEAKLFATTANADSDEPDNAHVLAGGSTAEIYSENTSNTTELHSNSIHVTTSNIGAGNPVNNVQPFTCINYIIALQGIFPSRN